MTAPVDRMVVGASQRGASDAPTVKSSEELAARTGQTLENLPGKEPGKDFIKEIGQALEKIVDRFRSVFTKERQEEKERSASPSPSPGD